MQGVAGCLVVWWFRLGVGVRDDGVVIKETREREKEEEEEERNEEGKKKRRAGLVIVGEEAETHSMCLDLGVS